MEEEETLGQLRYRQVLASVRAAVPGPRAVFVHIKVEDTDGEDAGGGGGEEATGGEGDKWEEEEEKEEEEEGQQRDQHSHAGADEAPPPRRARPAPGSYAITAVDYDEEEEEDEEEDEEWWGGDDEEEEEREEAKTEPRDPRAHESGASVKGGSEAVRPQRLTPGARSEPGSPLARLRTPGRVADKAVQDNNVRQPEVQGEEEEEEEEEEAGFATVLRKRGGGGPSGSSRFKGVHWDGSSNKWRARCKGKSVGYHTTEEAAARAYSKYLKDGIDHAGHLGASTSQFTGVSWNTSARKWQARCKRKHLGYHTTEEAAERAYSKYLEDDINPVEHRGASSSQFAGVSWNKSASKWQARCKKIYLGFHATEEDAARAYNKYRKDGIDPMEHRESDTSQFMGVCWNKSRNKWKPQCSRTYLGYHATEKAAALAYNVEAQRLGRPLNVIPPTGASGAGVGPRAGASGGDGMGAGAGAGAGGGAGPKRAAPKTPATPATSMKPKRAAPTAPASPATSKKLKL